MIDLILILPLILCLILFVFKKKFLNNFVIVFMAIAHFIISILLAIKGDFISFLPHSKFFMLTPLNKIFLMTMSIVVLGFSVYNTFYMKNSSFSTKKLRHYSYMVLFFIFSMTGAVLASNLGAAWVFIEGTTLASTYLIYFDKTKASIEAAFKYVFICSIGIALAFVGIILLIASVGNLNSLFYEDLYKYAPTFNLFWLKLSFVFIMFGIGTKMGLAPVHFWLPDAHSEAPSPISALLSASLLNCAFLMILNVYKITLLAGCFWYPKFMMLIMGFLSLFIAAVFVYHINNYKRMLAYSSIENMGILIIGAALGGAGLVASLIHLIGHSFAKAAFFMTSGNVLSLYKTKKIKSVKGLISTDKKTGYLYILSFLAIAGFPPSVIFISEFLTVKELIVQKHYILAGLFFFLLTLVIYGLARVVFSMCFSKKENEEKQTLPCGMYISQIALLIIVFVMGIYMPDNFVGELVTISSSFLGE